MTERKNETYEQTREAANTCKSAKEAAENKSQKWSNVHLAFFFCQMNVQLIADLCQRFIDISHHLS